MKNLTLKKIGIGAGLTGATAGLAYAAPLIGQLFAGNIWVGLVLTAVPTVIAYLTNSRTKVEESE